MRRICEQCGTSYNDTNLSTICPHQGFGYCEICDCTICVCDPKDKQARYETILAEVRKLSDYKNQRKQIRMMVEAKEQL